jgi:hypothetical protein
MFDENTTGMPVERPSAMPMINGTSIPSMKPVKLSEEEAIEFFGNWNLVTVFTLLDIDGFVLNPLNVSQKLSLTKSDAENSIEILKSMSLIVETSEAGRYLASPLYFDDSLITSADLINLFIRFSQISLTKITSKDLFGLRFEVMSRKVIQKYHSELMDIMTRISTESKLENDCEVYASSFLFSKISKTKKVN